MIETARTQAWNVLAQDSERSHVLYGWQPQRFGPLGRIDGARGVELFESGGRAVLDFCAGQINVNVGYGHPHVLAALRKQMEAFCYVAPNLASESRERLAEMVVEAAPGSELSWVFFSNSGSEAVENAMKIAWAFTGRRKLYAAWTSYHGATPGASSLSGDPRRLFVEPGLPGVRHFHAPTGWRCPFAPDDPEESARLCLSAFEDQALRDGPETIAAVFLEPIAGTSGLYKWPASFVRGLRAFCDKHGILLVFDETMSGWGRSGTWFACEHYDVLPDIMVTAKGITSGYVPLGATLITDRIRGAFVSRPFVAGLTTEGHALACAAGIANLEVYRNEGLIEHSRELGLLLKEHLAHLKDRHASVGDVRSEGLFGCIELTADREARSPLAGFRNSERDVAGQIVQRLWDAGLFLIAKWDFLFIAPPLVIARDDLERGLEMIDQVLDFTDSVIHS